MAQRCQLTRKSYDNLSSDRAKEAGMDEHVAKPVDGELLVKVIHKLVS